MELRWLTTNYEEWVDGSHLPKKTFTRVLQYRAEEGPQGEEWWGEWQDIPEVHVEA